MERNPDALRPAIRQLDRAELYIEAARSMELGDEVGDRLYDLVSELEAIREELRRGRAGDC